VLTRFDARSVAVTRILVGIAAVLLAVEDYGLLMPAATDHIAIPLFEAWGAVTPLEVWTIVIVSVVAGILLSVGLFSRTAAAVAALSSLAALLVEQQTYSSHQVLATLMCFYLVFADPGARFSLDSRIRGSVRQSVSRFPVTLMLTQVSVVYLFAAISKLNPVYLAGTVMPTAMIVPLPQPLPLLFAVSSIGLELFLAFALWFRRTTTIAIILGVGFHFVIAAMLHNPLPLWSFGLLMASTYPLFIARDPGVLRQWADAYAYARRTRLGASR